MRPRAATLAASAAWLAASLTLMAAGPAAATKLRSPALHWSRGSGAEGCIDPRTLAERVETYLGPALVAPSAADVSIEAHIERVGEASFLLRITVTEARGAPAGERVMPFDTGDCRSLDPAIAFLIAMTIDPDLDLQGMPPVGPDWLKPSETPAADALRDELAGAPARQGALAAPTSAMPTATQQPRATIAAATSQATPPSAAQPRVSEFSAIAGLSAGENAGISAGISAAWVRRFGAWFAAGAQLRGFASLTAQHVTPARDVTTQNVALGLLGCAQLPRLSVVSAQVCVGPELGVLIVRGHGYQPDQTALLWRAGGVARLDLRAHLDDSWALTLSGMLSADPAAPTAYYESGDRHVTVFKADRVTFLCGLGVTYSF
jgi:hypothetical protein